MAISLTDFSEYALSETSKTGEDRKLKPAARGGHDRAEMARGGHDRHSIVGLSQ